ncbi:MAG: catechol 2,3-dioxygenase-like lactoylglutathione lyase family enzyme [Alphaproteobacteria bacterium]|jgi:catechol 2,3-dioxygenase-like lactoylglutathione lyase family enzyme/predicted enzyme related to lactoylglutathione lyase
MNAKINHLTIVSEDSYALGRFYEGFFHMRPTETKDVTGAVRMGDGNIGLNIKPRLPGTPAQLHYFGIEVDNIELACARMHENYPSVEWLERSSRRPFPSIAAHDPDGNFFGLSQTGMKDCADIYEVEGRDQDRVIDHIALRVLHPEQVAEFYVKVFNLSPLHNSPEGGNFYLSDGHVTLAIIPWILNDFMGTGISARGMDHIGFKVESITALKSDIDRITEQNYRFQPRTSIVGRGKEGSARLAMFRKTCPLGCHHMADSDGFLLDVTE